MATLYFTDPTVAVHYQTHPGEWAVVADEAEAQWLLEQHHAYSPAVQSSLPGAYFIHPDAPPFVPYEPVGGNELPPAPPPPASRTILKRRT